MFESTTQDQFSDLVRNVLQSVMARKWFGVKGMGRVVVEWGLTRAGVNPSRETVCALTVSSMLADFAGICISRRAQRPKCPTLAASFENGVG